ncbi:Ankyrin repeat domain-containing protein 33B [Halotydeus destructor]|nr:Ankyrin repeat domain-containing protein 33B [Halotydeus destructor]
MTKSSLNFFFSLLSKRQLSLGFLQFKRRHRTATISPTKSVDSMGSNRDQSDPSATSDQERLLRRQLVTIRKKVPDIKAKDGQLIDPNSPMFLLQVTKEMDRSLLRNVKDMPLPANYVNYKDANGTTPLSFLCQKGDFVLVRMLCEMKGVDVNVQDNEGNTPLMIASQGGHASIVIFLIDNFKNEIDLNRRNEFGFTACMKAALTGRVKCLNTLLNAGANANLKDPNKGFTAA